MIDLDLGKLILLALIALVVLGPEKLPVAARTVGAIMRRMRGGWNSVRAEVERELQVVELGQAARDASKQVASAQAGLNATIGQLRGSLDAQTLDRLAASPSSQDAGAPESSRQIPLVPASTSTAASTSSARDHAAEELVHDRA
ncbi:MAG: Sec-independent protein translocase protein TatB [Pseudomonadota bacterium]|nr:Sec-independent protein translocase protein TatB [Pseudomonadota bacterium]